MAVVFINDHPFYYSSSGEVYTSGTLTSDVWSRFTDNFGELTVIGRGIKIDENNTNHKTSGAAKVTFDLFEDIKGGRDYLVHRKKIEAKLTPYILNSAYIVLRLPSSIGVVAAELCVKYKKKYLVEVVGCAFDSLWYIGNVFGKILAPVNAYSNRKAIATATAAVYVTTEYLQKRYPNENLQINASNVVIENFDDIVLSNHIEHIKRKTSVTVLGMIGNISLPYKGFEILFKALSRVKYNFKFLIVGGGNDRWIRSLIDKYQLTSVVILVGRINDRDEIYKFLDKLDVYIQPSLTEGLPRSVIEAMSRACPIIASDAGGNPELINSDLIYPRKSYKGLQCLIEKVIDNRSLLVELSEQNFLKSKEYTFDHINRRRYTFFNDVKSKLLNK